MYDLIVIGGGPAGCAAALTTARSGASVLLLERGEFPRQKVCGEFVSAESVGVLEKLLAAEDHFLITSAPRIGEARLFFHGAEIRADILPPALSIARFDLDQALWRSSILAGADARCSSTVRAVELRNSSTFHVVTTTESFSAKAVINASGRWSSLTATNRRGSLRGERWIGLKGHFLETSCPDSVDVYFFEGGYCGVQPVAGRNGRGARVNVCAMVKSETARNLAQVFGCHPGLARRSAYWEPASEPVSTSPLVFHPPEPLTGNMLQVGDAASFVDPFIGDGISLALRSGKLAGECLREFFLGESSLEQAAAEYSELYRKFFSPVVRASSCLRGMLRWPASIRMPALQLLKRAPLLTRQLVKLTR